MKRMTLAVSMAAALMLILPGPVAAADDSAGVLEKYARKLKWFHGEAGPGEKLEVLEAAMMAARAGVMDAQLYLAYAYIDGIGVEKDPEKGMALLRQAAENGNENARAALDEIEERADPRDTAP